LMAFVPLLRLRQLLILPHMAANGWTQGHQA
jgi:hypothetical protein